jgi:hypothetical protein
MATLKFPSPAAQTLAVKNRWEDAVWNGLAALLTVKDSSQKYDVTTNNLRTLIVFPVDCGGCGDPGAEPVPDIPALVMHATDKDQNVRSFLVGSVLPLLEARRYSVTRRFEDHIIVFRE